MKTKIAFISILLLVVNTIQTNAQTREISGIVLAFNTYPLKNITIRAKKTKSEVVTDADGKFQIEVKKNDQLIIDAETFERYDYKVKSSDERLRINLIYIDKKRNTDVTVDNGYLSREDLEYGLQNLISENSVFVNFTDIFDAIKYAVPTVNIINEGGQKKVLIRGYKSMVGNNGALTLVNGVAVDDISYLNPIEVIAIEQLSTSQAALYGSRGGNGVIKITTK